MHSSPHDELRALKSLEGEVARYEEHISAKEPPRRSMRILRQGFFAVLTSACIALALLVIVRLQSRIIDLEATQREMADSIAELKATQEELQALQKNEQPNYWYSHLPGLLFQNPVPQRPGEPSR